MVPLALLFVVDLEWLNSHLPAHLEMFQIQFVVPLLLLGTLWQMRAVHWVAAHLGMWLFLRRVELIVHRRPQRIILLRHGESMGNIDKGLYETIADNRIPLSEVGKQQAIKAGRKIKNLVGEASVGIFVSPFLRTQQTCAQILSQLDPSQVSWVRQDPRLREQEWGNFQCIQDSGKILRERERVGRFFYRFPTGESGADVYDRVSSFLQSLFRQFDGPLPPPENIIIVSHGLMMRFFCMRYFRWAVETFETVWNPHNCECWVLGKDERGHYSFINEGHLPKSTKPITIRFKDGRVDTLTLKDYIQAPVTERRRVDWIMQQLKVDPADVEEVILDHCRDLISPTQKVDDEMKSLLDVEEKVDWNGP